MSLKHIKIGDRHPSCSCGWVAERNKGYDAYYCPNSGVWLEPKCADPDCDCCQDRPDDAFYAEDEDSL